MQLLAGETQILL